MLTKKRDIRSGTTVWQATVGEKVATKAKPASNYYDIVIIGCGITGSMVAEQVSTLGLKVLVLDRREPASGSTSASTALIQWEIDQPLTSLQKKVGPKKANQSYLASFKAVSTLKRRIQNLQIDCDMIPRSSLLLAGNSMGSIALKREVAARKALKLPSTFLMQTDVKKKFGFDVDGAIVSTGSIEIDPRKLTISLVNIARKNGVEFVAPADVKRIYPTDVGVFIRLSDENVIAAGKVIAATGYERLEDVPKSKYDLISTWALATVPQKEEALWPTRALAWEASDPYLYFRTTVDNRIVVGGEDADFINPKKRDLLIKEKTRTILKKLSQYVPNAVLKSDFQWAGTFAESPTGLPTIGLLKELPNVFVILGAGGNGITFSVIAAEMAKSWIIGKQHLLVPVFAPHIKAKRK